MTLKSIFDNIKYVDTRLEDKSKPGISMEYFRWSVKTAGPSPFENIRSEMFLSGCKKARDGNPCKGCFNKSTWGLRKDRIIDDPFKVAAHIKESGNGYLTIGGGEPTDQIDGLIELLKELKNNNIHIILYTWRKVKEALNNNVQGVYPEGKEDGYNIKNDFEKILKYVDVIIDGEFVMEEKILDFDSENNLKHFVGSKNQIFWDVNKKLGYKFGDIESISININNDIEVKTSGGNNYDL